MRWESNSEFSLSRNWPFQALKLFQPMTLSLILVLASVFPNPAVNQPHTSCHLTSDICTDRYNLAWAICYYLQRPMLKCWMPSHTSSVFRVENTPNVRHARIVTPPIIIKEEDRLRRSGEIWSGSPDRIDGVVKTIGPIRISTYLLVVGEIKK